MNDPAASGLTILLGLILGTGLGVTIRRAGPFLAGGSARKLLLVECAALFLLGLIFGRLTSPTPLPSALTATISGGAMGALVVGKGIFPRIPLHIPVHLAGFMTGSALAGGFGAPPWWIGG
ncbi:hypothetical protein [Neomegalonema sp.]|uniref:hypothetical protein n=1 Tax=Neomegalonema sp. TaxID=2039713 RepID=UPI00260F08FF|nr:hypothetical protein [Neomegalonema sp.]MDD2869045.1 hypothetical protein [Neomegalonema sp.]